MLKVLLLFSLAFGQFDVDFPQPNMGVLSYIAPVTEQEWPLIQVINLYTNDKADTRVYLYEEDSDHKLVPKYYMYEYDRGPAIKQMVLDFDAVTQKHRLRWFDMWEGCFVDTKERDVNTGVFGHYIQTGCWRVQLSDNLEVLNINLKPTQKQLSFSLLNYDKVRYEFEWPTIKNFASLKDPHMTEEQEIIWNQQYKLLVESDK